MSIPSDIPQNAVVSYKDLMSLLNYVYYDEGKDYLSYYKPRPKNHIFCVIKRICKEMNYNPNKEA